MTGRDSVAKDPILRFAPRAQRQLLCGHVCGLARSLWSVATRASAAPGRMSRPRSGHLVRGRRPRSSGSASELRLNVQFRPCLSGGRQSSRIASPGSLKDPDLGSARRGSRARLSVSFWKCCVPPFHTHCLRGFPLCKLGSGTCRCCNLRGEFVVDRTRRSRDSIDSGRRTQSPGQDISSQLKFLAYSDNDLSTSVASGFSYLVPGVVVRGCVTTLSRVCASSADGTGRRRLR